MDVQKIYAYALQREHEGKRFFEQHAERFSHAAVVGAFQELAAEEQRHIDFIQSLIYRLEEDSEGLPGKTESEAEGLFSQRAASEDLDQTVIESMVPDLSVLRMAYLIERDFAEFYERAAEQADDGEAKHALELLARWERVHEALFKRMHDQAFEAYAGMPWGG